MKKKCMVLFLSLSMVLTLFVGCSDHEAYVYHAHNEKAPARELF